MDETTNLSGPLRDPEEIAQRAGLSESIGSYARLILDRLEQNDYQIPADGRTYGAVVYVAARDEAEPVTAEEIADASNIPETAITRGYKRVISALDITPERVPPSSFLDRLIDEFEVPEEVGQTAVDLLSAGREAELWATRSSAVSASLALYASAVVENYDDITQQDFEAVGVSGSAVRKNYEAVVQLSDESPTEEDNKIRGPADTPGLFEAVEAIHSKIEGVPERVLDDAREILSAVERQVRDEDSPESGTWVRGKSPRPIAAGAYWIAANRNRLSVSQSEVAQAADTHKVTVNRRVGTLREEVERGTEV